MCCKTIIFKYFKNIKASFIQIKRCSKGMGAVKWTQITLFCLHIL